MKTRDKLIEIMGQYTVESHGISSNALERTLKQLMDSNNHGFNDDEIPAQREYSINFKWGHNHDFGSFQLEGILGDRHIDLIETFVDDFGLPMDLSNTEVLDVGIWCGGTTLLLDGMGAVAYGIEEVETYANCARLLFKSFGCAARSYHSNLYDWGDVMRDEIYDYIIFPGVLYHLSDPLVALRILFNALKDGGELYIETAMLPRNEYWNCGAVLAFDGGERSNWFVPNSHAIEKMANVVGFELIGGASAKDNDKRSFFKLRRNEWKPMLRR
jgi:2-polyprenyl-3-methyl-5-hydroxy-6-metoxy-1,4-benzoquinol methylase